VPVGGFTQGTGSTRGDPGLGLKPTTDPALLVPFTNGAPDYWPQSSTGVTVDTGAALDDTGLAPGAAPAVGVYLKIGAGVDIGASEFQSLHPGGFVQGVGSTQGDPGLGLKPGSGSTLVAGTNGAPDYWPTETGVTVNAGAVLDDTGVSYSTDGPGVHILGTAGDVIDIGASDYVPPPPPGPLLQPVQEWVVVSQTSAGDASLSITGMRPTPGNLLVVTAVVAENVSGSANPDITTAGIGEFVTVGTHEGGNHLIVRTFGKVAAADDTGITVVVGDGVPRAMAILVHELAGELFDRDNPFRTTDGAGANNSNAVAFTGRVLPDSTYVYVSLGNRLSPGLSNITPGYSGTDSDNTAYGLGGYASNSGSHSVSVHGFISRQQSQGAIGSFAATLSSSQDWQLVQLELEPAPLGAGQSGHGEIQPPVEEYRFVLCDYAGSPYGDCIEALERGLSMRRNAFHSARVVFSLDDEMALNIDPGLTRLKVYREPGEDEPGVDDELVFYGYLPVTGSTEDTETNTITCEFADPRRELGRRNVNVPLGQTAAFFDGIDQGDILWLAISFQNERWRSHHLSDWQEAATDTWIRQGVTTTGVNRDRTYQRITVEQLIADMTSVIDGPDVDVTPWDGFAHGDPGSTGALSAGRVGFDQASPQPSRVMALFNAYPHQGSDKPDVIFSHGRDIATNVHSAQRTFLDFTNVALVLGTDSESGGEFQATAGMPDPVLGLHDEVLSDSDIHDPATAYQKAYGIIVNEGVRREVITLKTPYASAPRPFKDYYLGDTVRSLVQKGRFVSRDVVRVEGFDINLTREGEIKVEIVTSTVSNSDVTPLGPFGTSAPPPVATPPSFEPTAILSLALSFLASPTIGTSSGGSGGETFAPVDYPLWEATYYNKGLFGLSSGYSHATQVMRGTTNSAVAFYGDTISDVATIDTATPSLVTTKAAHGMSNGQRVGFDQLKKSGSGAAALNNRDVPIYAKTVTSTTFQLYTDVALTVPYHNVDSITANQGFVGKAFVSTWREIVINAGDNLATIGDGSPYLSGPDGSGFYTLQNIETNALYITGSDGARRKIKIRNVRVSNVHPDPDPQRVDPFTGHAEFKWVNFDFKDLHIYYGCGGAFNYSEALKGQRLIKGAAAFWSQSTGFCQNYFVEQAVYDLNKVNGSDMTAAQWWNFTIARHRGLAGGGHTDGWQITGLQNQSLTTPTFKYGWVESGGNSGMFCNSYASGTTVAGGGLGQGIDSETGRPVYIRNVVAQFCIQPYGNKFADLASCSLSGLQHCYVGPTTTALDLGNDDPKDATSTPPKATTHPMAQLPVGFDVWKWNDDASKGPIAFAPATVPTCPGPSSDPLRNPLLGSPWFYGPGPPGWAPNSATVPNTEYDLHYFTP
jgi:hypothetical protein